MFELNYKKSISITKIKLTIVKKIKLISMKPV